MQTKPKIIVILGQTATGKSDLAVKIAQKFSGEIISADSRQVYKGLNIGTGKVPRDKISNFPHFAKATRGRQFPISKQTSKSKFQKLKQKFFYQGIEHHLLDVISPKKRFRVSEYKKLAEKAIEKILKKEKMPIIVGGTGLYIQSIVDNVVYPEVKPNSKLRQKLSKLNTEKLFQILKNLDPQRAKNIDAKNPHRLIRAIEIAKVLGNIPKINKRESRWQALQIGIKLSDKILKERISRRLFARIRAGMINEAKKLHKQGLSWKHMEELGLEYRYLALYLQKKLTKEQFIEQLNNAIWQYAKRQWTWFKRDKRIYWFDVSKKSNLKKIEKLVKKFLRQDLILSR